MTQSPPSSSTRENSGDCAGETQTTSAFIQGGGFSGSDQRFPKRLRLRKREDFVRVQRRGRRTRSRTMVFMHIEAEQEWGRVGFTVSKKVGNAVKRAWLKRRLREIYRRNKARWPQGVDVVIIGRSSCLRRSYHELESEVLAWADAQVNRKI